MTAVAKSSAWRVEDIISPIDLPEIIKRTDAVRIDHQVLNVAPIRGLGVLGLPDIDISGKFYHMIVTLLNGNGEATVALHGLAARKGEEMSPLEVGEQNSFLRSYAIRANSKSMRSAAARHRYVEGKVFPLTDKIRADAAEKITIYGNALREFDVPYAVPLRTIRNEIQKALAAARNDPSAAARKLGFVTCDLFLNAPATLTKLIAIRKSGFPIAINGCNSNSVARDHAEMFGVNLLDIVTDAEAPLCEASVWKVLDKRLRKTAANAGHDAGLINWDAIGGILKRPERKDVKQPAVVAASSVTQPKAAA